MVEETVTMEGHLIDSDILRKAFARIVEGGGDFEILKFTVGKTNDDPSFIRLAIKAEAPDAVDRILEDLSYLGATTEGPGGRGHGKKKAAASTLVEDCALRPRGGGRDPARRVLLDHQLRHLRAPAGALGARARPEDGLRARAARGRADLRQAGPGPGGRAGGPARARHPRAPAGAQPRLLGLRVHVERRLRGDQQGDRHRGQRARDAAHARGGREDRGGGGAGHRPLRRRRGPGPPGARRLGGRPAHRQRLRHPRPREGGPEDEPRRVPDERPRHRGRQPPSPLDDQRRQPRGRHPRGGGDRARPLRRHVRGREEGDPVRLAGSIRDDNGRSRTSSPTPSPRRRPTSRPCGGRGCA